MKHVVIITGAGISAESGLKTFRDSDGLWNGYDVREVATPEAWKRNPSLVQDFYNMRRKDVLAASPNGAHLGLAQLERKYQVTIITQNIDDLHERAGSSRIIHLHGEIKKARSSVDPKLIYGIEGWELKMDEKCSSGGQLRPHIVWFGEDVPLIESAIDIVREADICVVIGTSLTVYPAASLVEYFSDAKPMFVIDPKNINMPTTRKATFIQANAVKGVEVLLAQHL